MGNSITHVAVHSLYSMIKMVNTFLTKCEGKVHIGCSRCNLKPSVALLDNSEQAILPSQQHTIKTFHATEVVRHVAEIKLALEIEAANATPSSSPYCNSLYHPI